LEAIENVFNGTARFGNKVTCQISRNGDLIHRTYLVVGLPALTGGSQWVKSVGLKLVQDVSIEIGGQQIDKHYSDWMFIWNELSLPAGKKSGYDKMIGNGAGANASAPGAGLAAESAATTLTIPLEFWFCRNVGLALPLIALQYHEVKININFETFASCLAVRGTANVEISAASLWVDYVYLDTDERRRFAQLSHEYLIEQLQFTGDEVIHTGTSRIKMNFNHPVKELVWVMPMDANVGSNAWTNYTNNATASGFAGSAASGSDPMLEGNIQLNGQDRFAKRPADYFTLVQPYQHHENVPTQTAGIHVYSFALKPEEHQPSGSLNFSRIDTAYLNLSTSLNGAGRCKIFAVNYNVLRIMSGINEFRHQHSKLTCAQQSAAKYGYCRTILDKQCKHNLVYNWLVVREFLSRCNKIKLSGTPFRALTTTPVWKHTTGTLGNDHGHSKNVKDWVIRSQAPAVLNTLDRVKVQRTDGFGGERNVILCDLLRYVPALCESMGSQPGGDWHIQIDFFLTVLVRKKYKNTFIFQHKNLQFLICSHNNTKSMNQYCFGMKVT